MRAYGLFLLVMLPSLVSCIGLAAMGAVTGIAEAYDAGDCARVIRETDEDIYPTLLQTIMGEDGPARAGMPWYASTHAKPSPVFGSHATVPISDHGTSDLSHTRLSCAKHWLNYGANSASCSETQIQ